MFARDWFGVGVRLIGLWQVVQGLYWGFYALLKYGSGFGNPSIPPQQDLGLAAFYAVLGVLLIVLADSIVRGIYGPRGDKA